MNHSLMKRAIEVVESGRDIDWAGGPVNDTLLHEACDEDDINTIKYLVDHGADINKPNKYGNTPFHYYVFREPSIRMVNYLLDKGADKDKLDDYGQTVAQRARQRKNVDVAEFIESYEPVPTKGVQSE